MPSSGGRCSWSAAMPCFALHNRGVTITLTWETLLSLTRCWTVQPAERSHPCGQMTRGGEKTDVTFMDRAHRDQGHRRQRC